MSDQIDSSQAGAVFKVFICSTAQDLEPHRDLVAEIIESMGLLPVRMETFAARPRPAVAECRELVATTNVVVAMVAHRYGWVPTPEEGGDGNDSITWLEIRAARQASVDVLAFVVDPAYEWTGGREQDDLTRAADETSALRVYNHVRQLSELKLFLGRNFITSTFTTPNDLARKVAASLHNWLKERKSVVSVPIVEPRSNLPAQPDLVGREKEQARILTALASSDPIVLIDGIGGIGKTALALNLAHRCLATSRNSRAELGLPRFTNFVWTSAKDRELLVEEFLDTIARTLGVPEITQRTVEERTERVRHLLAEESCLLILDNFEAVRDARIRAFLATLPARSKALLTSRTRELFEAWPGAMRETG